MTRDLQRAYTALKNKQQLHSTRWDYYDGDHPLIYSTERLRSVFQNLDARFSENWSAVVVDSELERVDLQSLAVTDSDELTERLNQLWEDTELDLDEELVHKAAMVTREAYVIAWRDDADGEVEAYYNDPRNVHAFYDGEKPREMRFAAKWWVNETGHLRMTLYHADHLEYYVSQAQAKDLTKSDDGWKSLVPVEPYTEDSWPDNPYEQIPVFHFRYERRGVKSALDNVIEPQNVVNKLLNDMMVAAEFGAFRQRWIISNADTETLKNAPNEVWDLPAGDGEGQQTQVGEFSETNLDNYIKAMDREASVLSAITRTPKHYFFTTGSTPSGEALIALEAPLNKKAARFIKLQAPVWRKVAAFLLRLDGVDGVDDRQIEPVFDQPETVQPRTQAEIREINGRAGLPLRTSLRWEGRSEAEIQQVEQDIEQEQQMKQLSFASALLDAQRQFDQGNGATPAPQEAINASN